MKTYKEQLSAKPRTNGHDRDSVSAVEPAHVEELSTKPPQPGEKSRFRGQLTQFTPFPVEMLAGPVRDFVIANSLAIDVDTSFLALPVLAVLASAIGNTRRIRLKKSWSEPAIVWAAIVAGSGMRKSPPIDAAVKPLRDRQSKAMALHAEAMVEHEQAIAEFNAAAKRYKGQGEPPKRPAEPVADRFLAADLTVEALAFLLAHQPRGLLVCRDELDGWLSGFDQYRAGKGADIANWLELHGGRSITVDRRTGSTRTLHIPRAACSLCGGVQPGILAQKLTSTHVASGLVARILFAFPPSRPRRWTDADVDDRVTERYSRVVNNLSAIQFETDDNGQPVPAMVDLSPDAKRRFAEFVNQYGAEHADADDALTASFAKLEGYAARFALILHLTRWACGETVNPTICDAPSVEAGITLSRWFSNEARRVHGLLTETADESEDRKLIDWIHRHGGRITARDLSMGHRRYRPVEDAEQALQRLVDAVPPIGSWIPQPTGDDGGRPTRLFVLSTVNETPKTQLENRGFVDNDTPDIPQFDPGDDSTAIDFDEINDLFGGRDE